ncbi:MAG TPA: FAD:protein FMN transferase [Gaiellaceae bacterium]|jgi:thiamine biosynthesis lipoprotein
MLHRRFPAMGTEIRLVLDAPPSASAFAVIAAAEADVRRLERLLSRFDPESQLSRLNRRRSLVVVPELLELVQLALDARDRTDGRFDPTVHDAVVAAGYDRTFEQVPRRGAGAAAGARCGGGVRVDATNATIELDPGVRLDLGGIAKGYAADRAAALLGAVGPCLVDAGGDIAVRGRAWPVGVETADGQLTLELPGGGIATSGRDRRRWRRGGEEQHHLIDPASGRPSRSDLLRVTAVADTAVEAEVLAKTLFLAGALDAKREADARWIPAVLVTQDGRRLLAGGLAAA